MYIKIQISDALYQALLTQGKRKKGSIALVSPKEGNFNAFASNSETRKQRKFIRLAHGSASVGDERISRREAEVMPAQVICKESEIAGEFVTKNC
jgi:hypothetical protein